MCNQETHLSRQHSKLIRFIL